MLADIDTLRCQLGYDFFGVWVVNLVDVGRHPLAAGFTASAERDLEGSVKRQKRVGGMVEGPSFPHKRERQLCFLIRWFRKIREVKTLLD
jgi:hypothetical protein